MRSEREVPHLLHTTVEKGVETIYPDRVPATTSGRKKRARAIAPVTLRCNPSSRNQRFPRL
jgi:hypothetical protein